MKWITKRTKPREGDTRTVTRFAFFPKNCGHYTVWLECYESVQQYKAMTQFSDGTIPMKTLEWVETQANWLTLYP